MYNKDQITQKISQISRQKHKLDDLYVMLQKSVASYQSSRSQAKSVVIMRQNFTSLTNELSSKIFQRTKQLDSLCYRCQKLCAQGISLSSAERNLMSLQQYFKDLKQKLQLQKQKGELIISQKQRWQLNLDNQNITQEEISLLNARKGVGQMVGMADNLIQSLQDQGRRLGTTRDRMGGILKNINLVANITMMIRTRTRQDNQLIIYLTIGLIVQIFLCLFVIKPLVQG